MAARQFNTLSLLRLRPAAVLYRRVADERTGPGIRRDLSDDPRRDRRHAPRQDGRYRSGGGSGARGRPDRLRGDHQRQAVPRGSRRLQPVALPRSLGRSDGRHVLFLDIVRNRRVRPLPQPLHGVRIRAGDPDLHRVPDGRGDGHRRGAFLGHQLDRLGLDGSLERHGRLLAARPRPAAKPPALPESRPAAAGIGVPVVQPAGVRRHPGSAPAAAESSAAERARSASLRSGAAVPGVGTVLGRPGRLRGPGRRGILEGLLAAQRRDLDRLRDAVGFPRGTGCGPRAPRAFRLGVRRLHLPQSPGRYVPAAPDHGGALGPDRVDHEWQSPTNRKTARGSSFSLPKRRSRPAARSPSASATTCSTPAASARGSGAQGSSSWTRGSS